MLLPKIWSLTLLHRWLVFFHLFFPLPLSPFLSFVLCLKIQKFKAKCSCNNTTEFNADDAWWQALWLFDWTTTTFRTDVCYDRRISLSCVQSVFICLPRTLCIHSPGCCSFVLSVRSLVRLVLCVWSNVANSI